VNVNFGLRTLLLIAATLLFLFAVFSDSNWTDLVAWGLALCAFSFVIGDLGWDRR
jgi:peptidoglycan/LPS O-acetylase OafA/YrhL